MVSALPNVNVLAMVGELLDFRESNDSEAEAGDGILGQVDILPDHSRYIMSRSSFQ